MEPVGKVLEVPANPCRQRAVLVVLVHGGEIAPCGIAALEFDDAGLEVDPEPLPQEKEEGGSRGWLLCCEAWKDAGGCEKEREKACFEEHAVGLIAGEVLRGADEGEEAAKAEEQHGAWPDVCEEKQGGDEADPAEGHQSDVAGGEPKERGGVPEA